MSRKVERPALLVRVLTELGAGRITEGWLADKHCFVHGETDGRVIRINPAIGVVDTVIHECLHRLEPSWSENYVRRTTTWVMRRCSDEQLQAIYVEYTRIAKKRKSHRRTDAG